MKLVRFTAESLFRADNHVSIAFDDQVTFLIGVNGSGKTAVLRLVHAILEPSIRTLALAPFKRLLLETSEITVIVSKTEEHLTIASPTVGGTSFRTRIAEARDPDTQFALDHPILRQISTARTPLFMRLNRSPTVRAPKDRYTTYTNFYFHSGTAPRDMGRDEEHGYIQLDAAIESIRTVYAKIKSKEAEITNRLRHDLLVQSFSFQKGPHRIPSTAELEVLKENVGAMRASLRNLDLDHGELTKNIGHFVDEVSAVQREIAAATRAADQRSSQRKRKKAAPPAVLRPSSSEEHYTRVANMFYLPRLVQTVGLLTDAETETRSLRRPIDEFVARIDRFLSDAGFRLLMLPDGTPRLVPRSGTTEAISMDMLSSGQRHIVALLATLSFSSLHGDHPLFLIDEPELSLHVGWQDQLVDSLAESDTSAQFVFATHSPAIVGHRRSQCRDLTAGGRAVDAPPRLPAEGS